MFPEEVVLQLGSEGKVVKISPEREEEHLRWRELGSSGPNMHEVLKSRKSMEHSRTGEWVSVAREGQESDTEDWRIRCQHTQVL